LIGALRTDSKRWFGAPEAARATVALNDPFVQEHMKTIATLVATLANMHNAWSGDGSTKRVVPSASELPRAKEVGDKHRLVALLVQVQNELERCLAWSPNRHILAC
jgi:hypothetical protein